MTDIADPPRPPADADFESGDVFIKVDRAVWNRIRELAEAARKTPGELLGDAIGLEQWAQETRQSGRHIFVQSEDGTLDEVRVK